MKETSKWGALRSYIFIFVRFHLSLSFNRRSFKWYYVLRASSFCLAWKQAGRTERKFGEREIEECARGRTGSVFAGYILFYVWREVALKPKHCIILILILILILIIYLLATQIIKKDIDNTRKAARRPPKETTGLMTEATFTSWHYQRRLYKLAFDFTL